MHSTNALSAPLSLTRVAGAECLASGREILFVPSRPGALGGRGFVLKDPGNPVPRPQPPLVGQGAGIPPIRNAVPLLKVPLFLNRTMLRLLLTPLPASAH